MTRALQRKYPPAPPPHSQTLADYPRPRGLDSPGSAPMQPARFPPGPAPVPSARPSLRTCRNASPGSCSHAARASTSACWQQRDSPGPAPMQPARAHPPRSPGPAPFARPQFPSLDTSEPLHTRSNTTFCSHVAPRPGSSLRLRSASRLRPPAICGLNSLLLADFTRRTGFSSCLLTRSFHRSKDCVSITVLSRLRRLHPGGGEVLHIPLPCTTWTSLGYLLPSRPPRSLSELSYTTCTWTLSSSTTQTPCTCYTDGGRVSAEQFGIVRWYISRGRNVGRRQGT